MRILKRCLAISVLDLSLNLPNYLLRLYLNLVPDEAFSQINPHMFSIIQDFSQILYFSQFALNVSFLNRINIEIFRHCI